MGRKANPALDVKGKADSYLAKRIRERMDEQGITSPTLAKHLHCTPQAVNQYRQGVASPSCRTLLEIARFLGTTTDYLLGEAEGKTADNQKINERLGLVDSAIDILERSWPDDTDTYNPAYTVAINALLGTEKGLDLLGRIAEYISVDFSSAFILADNYEERRVSEIWFNLGTTSCVTKKSSDLGKVLLLDIPKMVDDLRIEYLKSDLPKINL